MAYICTSMGKLNGEAGSDPSRGASDDGDFAF